MAAFVKRLVKAVTVEGSPEALEYVPANGERIEITRFSSSGIYCSPDVKAEIKWDGDLIYVAHGSFVEHADGSVLVEIVGDGTKKLILYLVNDSSGDESLQVGVYGEAYGS